jgi:Deoxyribonuclease NucA/NucB
MWALKGWMLVGISTVLHVGLSKEWGQNLKVQHGTMMWQMGFFLHFSLKASQKNYLEPVEYIWCRNEQDIQVGSESNRKGLRPPRRDILEYFPKPPPEILDPSPPKAHPEFNLVAPSRKFHWDCTNSLAACNNACYAINCMSFPTTLTYDSKAANRGPRRRRRTASGEQKKWVYGQYHF